MNKIKLPKEDRDKWLEALRSGKYEQGHYQLYNGRDGYCCLGVFCKIKGVPDEEMLGHGIIVPDKLSDEHRKNIPDALLYKWDDRSSQKFVDTEWKTFPVTEQNFTTYLANLNDKSRLNLEQIADVIEETTIGV